MSERHPCDYCGTMLDEDDCVMSDIPAVNGPMLHTASQCREYVYAALQSYKREVATLRAQLLDDAAKLQEGIALVTAKVQELGATTETCTCTTLPDGTHYPACPASPYQAGIRSGRSQERAAIVAWMRAARVPHAQADAIERGDHVKPLRPSSQDATETRGVKDR